MGVLGSEVGKEPGSVLPGSDIDGYREVERWGGVRVGATATVGD